MKTLTILTFFMLYIPIVFSQKSKKIRFANGFKDTLTFKMLTFSKLNHKPFLFDTTSLDTSLSPAEVQLAEELFFKGIDDAGTIPIDTKTYFKQLVPILTKTGEKKIYINCFNWSPGDYDFRNEENLVEVNDGGDNYFRVVVNISAKTVEFVHVNFEG